MRGKDEIRGKGYGLGPGGVSAGLRVVALLEPVGAVDGAVDLAAAAVGRVDALAARLARHHKHPLREMIIFYRRKDEGEERRRGEGG